MYKVNVAERYFDFSRCRGRSRGDADPDAPMANQLASEDLEDSLSRSR